MSLYLYLLMSINPIQASFSCVRYCSFDIIYLFLALLKFDSPKSTVSVFEMEINVSYDYYLLKETPFKR